MGARFNGGLYRRRFVQDGDIPVTVLRRDERHEVSTNRGVVARTDSRLQRTDAALAAEIASRGNAERSLAETQSALRDLQTRIGHAELAKSEAVDALRQEREAIAQLRAESAAWAERLQEARLQVCTAERTVHLCQEQLAEKRLVRKTAEQALRLAEYVKDAAEQLVQTLSEEGPDLRHVPPQSRRSRVVTEPEVIAVPAQRGGTPYAVAAEPEPVRWWLNTKPVVKKR